MAAEGFVECAGVEEVRLDQRRPRRHGIRVALGEIVVDDDLVTPLEQHLGHDAADVAGASRHQHSHYRNGGADFS